MGHKKKSFIIMVMIFLFTVQILPTNVYATNIQKEEKAKEAIDYALFSANEDKSLSINASKATINGDIHANADFMYRGSSLSIEGTCEASGKVNVKGSKSIIKNKIEDSSVIEMPDYIEDIKSIASMSADVYKTDKKYTGSNIAIPKSVIVDGKIKINGSKLTSDGYIIATKDIAINTSKTETGKGIVIASETGDISFNGSSVNFKGVIYAPKGTVTINSANFTLDGRIIADKIVFKGSSLNVTSSPEDYELINGFELKEAPVLSVEKSDEGFKLNWNLVKNASKYTVMRKIDDGQYEVISEDLTQNIYTDTELDVYGIYTYKVVATNIKNESIDSNEVYAYVSEIESGILPLDKINTDTDGDGLTDFLETNKYYTDINMIDTDGDGVKDGDEVFKLFTDPTKTDTDGNGITDDKEDFDGDGIQNSDELAKETDPWLIDSDLDGLIDYQEIYIYNTDPNMEDTDGDELSDKNEILQGTNPLVADTDNDGIKDGDEVFDITVEIDEIEKDEKVEPSVKMDLEGKYIDSVTISNVGQANPYLQSDIPGYIGAPYEFFAPMTFDSAEMKFKFDKELLNQEGFEPAIYYFNEETKLLELLPNQSVDFEECTVSAEVNHFSTYILLNKTTVDEFWEKEMKAPFEGELENIELVIGFAIDSSGSMSWNDPAGLRKQTAKDFVNNMDENDRAAVIDFDSSAKVNCSLTSDKTVIKNAIDRIGSSGGTNLSVGIQAALTELKTSTSKAKYIIMLTDGEGSYNHNLTQQAIEQGVKIYTIGLGSSVDVNLLKNISDATGGKYYHASTASDLSGIFDQTSEETVDLTKDTDGDGISDYHEKRGVRVNTRWIYTDYDNPDTDGDGLKDGEELTYKNGYFKMNTDPTKKDSDNDGINDNIDPEPMVYSITDRTLALSASLSYTNLESDIGNFVGDKGESELSNFKIIHANNSGNDSLIGDIVEGIMDNGLGSAAIKISRSGKRDAVILSYRGSEFDDDVINDGGTDLIAALLTYNPQASWVFNDANKEYRKLIKEYPNADFYLSGHSLGGRIVQDVLFSVLDDNIGWFSKEVKKPVHCATFNGFGYNKADFYGNKLIQKEVFTAAEELLNNYYYQYDLVGDGLGASALFKRIGTDKGPWIAKDENGNVIDAPKVPVLNMVFSELHGIDLFYKDSRLKYPQTTGIY